MKARAIVYKLMEDDLEEDPRTLLRQAMVDDKVGAALRQLGFDLMSAQNQGLDQVRYYSRGRTMMIVWTHPGEGRVSVDFHTFAGGIQSIETIATKVLPPVAVQRIKRDILPAQ